MEGIYRYIIQVYVELKCNCDVLAQKLRKHVPRVQLTPSTTFFLLCRSPSSEDLTGIYRYGLQPVNFRAHSTVDVQTLNIRWQRLNTEAASSNLSRRACHELRVNTRHNPLITAT